MLQRLKPFSVGRRILMTLIAVGIGGLISLASAASTAAPPKAPPPKNGKQPPKAIDPPSKPVAPPAPRSAILTSEAWQKVPIAPAQPGEIDKLVQHELELSKITPAALTSDEQFLRRVTLDLTGQLPLPADVTEFVADREPKKRAKIIDKLLDSDEYAQHWSRYWRDVIGSRVTDFRGLALARPFEAWMADNLKKNSKWDFLARAMITAEGACQFDDEGQHGNLFFLASHHGPDAGNERAAETSRVFLGIQIQCAQCHDHPSDQWKRVQFHELAGYFARVQERPVKGDKNKPAGMELFAKPKGEHEMPSKEDPKKTLITYPRFLDGKGTVKKDANDHDRRKTLADAIVDQNNYWFAGAYVNRIWGELMGQSFYQPVDDMGPKKEAVFADVLVRLASDFRATHYDMKGMFRLILNTQTYQRQIRLGETSDQHLHFAAAYPTRLRSDALWDALTSVLGSMGAPPPANVGKPGGKRSLNGLQALFNLEFSFDPSAKSDDVEGSISQALLMMNNPAINNRIQARGTNLLARVLVSYPQDDDAVRILYLRTLARKPTDKERDKCNQFIAKVGNRSEAFEDILWALINSTEFQTKR